MSEIRIKNAPEELKELLKAEAKRLGMDVRAVMLFRLWGSQSAPYEGAARGISETPRGPEKTPSEPRAKFTPPTLEEAQKEIAEKGYHFGAQEFVAWNGARGWKTRQGPMRNWKLAMVTWESRWKERQAETNLTLEAGHGGAQRTGASEQRVERSKLNIIDGVTTAVSKSAAADGRQREDRPVKRIGD